MSAEGKWTAGPWYSCEPAMGFGAIKAARDDGDILIFGLAAGADDERRTEKEIEANARLIAASPDMAEALREAEAAMAAMLPTNARLDNTRIHDGLVLPMDVSMGELRRLSAALTRARAALAKGGA